tara:strand:- start:20793 stop:21572 length:780 start_codon:yes stop_codon:yes gene_type:complete
MSFDVASITKSSPANNHLVIIHGPPGIGKTTFAAQFTNPLFIMTDEGGLGSNEVHAFPMCKKMSDVFESIRACFKLKVGDRETLVIDSLSSLEAIIFKQVAIDNGFSRLENVAYGKGYDIALSHWVDICSMLRNLLDNGIFKYVVLIAHTDVSSFKNPDGEDYNFYNIKLHRKAAGLFLEQADVVGFASQPVIINSSGPREGVAGKKGGPVLHLKQKPTLLAKNRRDLPDMINFNAKDFLDGIETFENQNKNEIKGQTK